MDAQAFTLTEAATAELRNALRARIVDGLSREGGEISALPAYLPLPSPALAGIVGVLDIGGTNVRAALVRVEGGGEALVVAGPLERRLEIRAADAQVDATSFFRTQAELIRELEPPERAPYGYCFSYPARTLPDRDAELLRWTKDIDVAGVVGTPVGSALRHALGKAGLKPGRVTVVNDTVASLYAGSMHLTGLECARTIGLIVGTGSNMAAFFGLDKAPKLRTAPGLRGKMAVNLESGNFLPPHLTAADDAVDSASENPGRQRFEKAIAGYYLPQLYMRARGADSELGEGDGTRALVALRDAGPESEPGRLAAALLGRSADLVAAGLSAVMALLPPAGPTHVIAEGSLFWGDKQYRGRVEQTLRALTPEREFKIERRHSANLIGAAGAALTP